VRLLFIISKKQFIKATTEKTKTSLATAEKELEAAVKNYASALDAEMKNSRAVFPDSTMRAIINFINQAKGYFAPFDHPLTYVERRRLIGSGFKNFGFIEQTYANAVANPSLVPAYLNIATFKEEIDDFTGKRNLDDILKQFELQVSDSMLVASDVAYHDALIYYNAVKEAARQHVPGAEAAYNALKDYFKSHGRTKIMGEPTEAEVERDVRALLRGTKDDKIVIENERLSVSGGEHKVVDEVYSERVAVRKGLNEVVKS
jgi:hypothetical protein